MSDGREVLPTLQYAVQLVAKGRMALTTEKPVSTPESHQILARVEAVGLCFSDLKLLTQFDAHPRKSGVLSGPELGDLDSMPHYVPGDRPTVPGHEVCCRVVAVGSAVTRFRAGDRCVVQPDYRRLPTAGSNAAFGYNFEGGLQEYVLLDDRILSEDQGPEELLIPAPDALSASSVALIEPWSCVEHAYAAQNRRCLKAKGQLLVVVDAGKEVNGLTESMDACGRPAVMVTICADPSSAGSLDDLGIPSVAATSLQALAGELFDDIVYFGSSADTIEVLNDMLAPHAVINIVLGGVRIGRPVSIGVGKVHYGETRWVGTLGNSAADSYRHIPATGEIRPGDSILVVGAGGPMGQMHVIRSLCSGIPDISIVGTDVDDGRLAILDAKAAPLSAANGVPLRLVNTAKASLSQSFSYQVLLAPVGALVAQAVRDSVDGTLIDIFAGIPAQTRHELDLDTYIAHHCYMFGTSGTVIKDMETVREDLEHGQLDTDLSVDAVSGMAGAVDALAAVENRSLAGKIVVYPTLHGLGLVPLSEMPARFPSVASRLQHGHWCREAEAELLQVARD